jgi:hypothetical protein
MYTGGAFQTQCVCLCVSVCKRACALARERMDAQVLARLVLVKCAREQDGRLLASPRHHARAVCILMRFMSVMASGTAHTRTSGRHTGRDQGAHGGR